MHLWVSFIIFPEFDWNLSDPHLLHWLVPRKSDFGLDVDGIIRAVHQHSPKVIFLTSPNNPDGRCNV